MVILVLNKKLNDLSSEIFVVLCCLLSVFAVCKNTRIAEKNRRKRKRMFLFLEKGKQMLK